MSDALFSIIPLMIGVFGGTISVVVVIRNIGNNRVKGNLDAIQKMIDEMVGKKVADDTNKLACSHRDKVEYCRNAFGMCTLIPVIIFAVWIIMVSFCVSLNRDCIKALNYLHNHNLSEPAPDRSQTKEEVTVDSHLSREVLDSTTKWLGSVLLNNITILLVTLADSAFIIVSLGFLRRAKTQYGEVKKIYNTFMENLPKKERDILRTGGTTV